MIRLSRTHELYSSCLGFIVERPFLSHNRLTLTVGWLAVLSALLVNPDWANAEGAVVVRPSAWKDAIQEWKQYRLSQGNKVFELDAELGAPQLKESIKTLAESEKLNFVLLAGSVRPPANLPTFHHKSTALVQHGGTEYLASDNDYADINGDGLPDLAVGRIPAHSAEQLHRCLQKSIEYESGQDYSQWRRDVHVVAGVGGFGPLADSMIETVSRSFLTDKIPGWINLSMTHANLTSHYCPDPQCLTQTCLDRFGSGGLFWIYIGHGWVDRLDDFQSGEQSRPIIAKSDLENMDSRMPPIAVFLACYTGAIDAIETSLAEDLVLKPDGAIAAIAASRVSGPYGLAVLSDGLLSSCFEQQCSTLGEVVANAKRCMMDDSRFEMRDAPVKQLASIHAMAKLMSPKGYDLNAERMEHVWQMNLLGDPMLRLCHPGRLEIEMPSHQWPLGQPVPIRGQSSGSGKLTIELTRRRGHRSGRLKASEIDWTSQEGRAAFDQRYQQANQLELATFTNDVSAGAFSTQLSLPDNLAAGTYGLRFFLQSDDGWHIAYHELQIIE